MTEIEKKNEGNQFKFSFRFHVIIFLITNGLLLVINEMFTPSYLWVLYPFFGWFIGISVHLTLIYTKKLSKPSKEALVGHFSIYFSTNLLLIVINYYNGSRIDWALFPLLFWGVALIFHAVVYWEYLANRPISTAPKRKKLRPKGPPGKLGDKLASLKKRAQLMHASEPTTIATSNQESGESLESVKVNLEKKVPLKLKNKSKGEELIDISEAEAAELKKTESELAIEEKEIKCLVHKGPIEGTVYICKCKAHYCLNCVKVLKEKGEKCWVCESELKP